MDPVEFSKQTKAEAEEILGRTNLLALLGKYGDVRIGGSYFTDLMYGPDIDIAVATDDPRAAAVRFLNDAIEKRVFQKYQYGDFEAFPREHRPTDHIVVLILPFKERTWEIEIWFSKEHPRERTLLEEKLKSLPSETKREIIELKADRERSGLDKHALSSFQIYQKFV